MLLPPTLQVTRVCSQEDFESGGLNLTATVIAHTLTGSQELLQLIAVSAVNLTQVRSMNVSVSAGNVTRLGRAGEPVCQLMHISKRLTTRPAICPTPRGGHVAGCSLPRHLQH